MSAPFHHCDKTSEKNKLREEEGRSVAHAVRGRSPSMPADFVVRQGIMVERHDIRAALLRRLRESESKEQGTGASFKGTSFKGLLPWTLLPNSHSCVDLSID